MLAKVDPAVWYAKIINKIRELQRNINRTYCDISPSASTLNMADSAPIDSSRKRSRSEEDGMNHVQCSFRNYNSLTVHRFLFRRRHGPSTPICRSTQEETQKAPIRKALCFGVTDFSAILQIPHAQRTACIRNHDTSYRFPDH